MAANSSGKFTYTAVRSATNDTTATGDLFGVSFKLANGVESADFVITSSYPTGAFTNAQGKSVEVNAVSDAIGYLEMTTTKATANTDGTTKETTTVGDATNPTTNKTTANGDKLMGDVNRDGNINSFDILLLKRAISQKTGEEDIMDVADMSADGKLNSFDIMLIKKAVFENN